MREPKVLAIILAGGRGERLSPLTQERSKPAVPFGGRYRARERALGLCTAWFEISWLNDSNKNVGI